MEVNPYGPLHAPIFFQSVSRHQLAAIHHAFPPIHKCRVHSLSLRWCVGVLVRWAYVYAFSGSQGMDLCRRRRRRRHGFQSAALSSVGVEAGPIYSRPDITNGDLSVG